MAIEDLKFRFRLHSSRTKSAIRNPQSAIRRVPALCARRSRLLLLAAAALTLNGCVLNKETYRPVHYFDLKSDGQVNRAEKQIDVILGIAQFQMIGPYKSRMVYRKSANRLAVDDYNRWIQPPEKLTTLQVHRGLLKSGLFKDIIKDRTNAGDFRLTASIHDMEYGPDRKAHFEIDVLIRAVEDDVIVHHKTYRADVPVQRPEPESLAAALAEGLLRIINELIDDLQANDSLAGGR